MLVLGVLPTGVLRVYKCALIPRRGEPNRKYSFKFGHKSDSSGPVARRARITSQRRGRPGMTLRPLLPGAPAEGPEGAAQCVLPQHDQQGVPLPGRGVPPDLSAIAEVTSSTVPRIHFPTRFSVVQLSCGRALVSPSRAWINAAAAFQGKGAGVAILRHEFFPIPPYSLSVTNIASTVPCPPRFLMTPRRRSVSPTSRWTPSGVCWRTTTSPTSTPSRRPSRSLRFGRSERSSYRGRKLATSTMGADHDGGHRGSDMYTLKPLVAPPSGSSTLREGKSIKKVKKEQVYVWGHRAGGGSAAVTLSITPSP